VIEAPFFTESPIPVNLLEEKVRLQEDKSVVTFQGVVRRDKAEAGELVRLEFEADRRRAEDELQGIVRDVSERWHGAELLFVHRLGAVPVGETCVFIAVSAERREDALAGCRHAADRLKSLPGLRKKDVFRDGTSKYSFTPHITILLSDDALSVPES
jgi:molybdopterin synthase catalytic subunit